MTEELLSEFNSPTKQDWLNQISKEIKDADTLQKLNSRLWDQIQINPFYTKDDLNGPVSTFRFNSLSDIPGSPPRLWNNMVNILTGDTNSYILNSLENGAEGLILHLHGIEDLSELLQGVHPEYIPILIRPLGDPILVLNSYFYWVESTGAPTESITGGLHWTPAPGRRLPGPGPVLFLPDGKSDNSCGHRLQSVAALLDCGLAVGIRAPEPQGIFPIPLHQHSF